MKVDVLSLSSHFSTSTAARIGELARGGQAVDHLVGVADHCLSCVPLSDDHNGTFFKF